MNPKKAEPYIPPANVLTLLYTLANLGHSISGYAILATFSTSPTDLEDYMILMGEQTAEIQRLIQEFRQTSQV